jgi:prepilin-type N-terminal cleavage/methylation domain-containing protein
MLRQIRKWLKGKCKGFSLVEAMVSTAIMGIGFVGVYTLVATSETLMSRSIGRQKVQMIADQIMDVIETDLSNINSYAMTLATCTSPATANQYDVRGYEWCIRLNTEIGAAVTGETRSITVTTLADGRKVVHIVIDGYNSKIQVVMDRAFNI